MLSDRHIEFTDTLGYCEQMNIRVDTLEYSNTLEQAGIARPHAEAIAKLQARAIEDLVAHELVTKESLRSELSQLEARLESRLSQLDARIDSKMSQSELRQRYDMHALRAQLRSLQYGGAIAMFALSLIVVMMRLIK